MPTTYRILVGCALITAVALISDRSSALAGILGTAPINIPIVLWIIWSKSASNYPDVELTSRAMLLGITSTACFIAVCWYGFSRRWSFALTMGAGYLVWAAVAFGPALLRRLVERG
jgi:type IV secretory pathway VirB6-like protein